VKDGTKKQAGVDSRPVLRPETKKVKSSYKNQQYAIDKQQIF